MWSAERPSVEVREATMKGVLALHVAVKKLRMDSPQVQDDVLRLDDLERDEGPLAVVAKAVEAGSPSALDRAITAAACLRRSSRRRPGSRRAARCTARGSLHTGDRRGTAMRPA
jgi:hypothetical protein